LPQFVHGNPETVFKVHKRVGGPKLLSEFFPAYYLPRLVQEGYQHSQRLILKSDAGAPFAQLTRLQI
jgi:hypothetical protein